MTTKKNEAPVKGLSGNVTPKSEPSKTLSVVKELTKEQLLEMVKDLQNKALVTPKSIEEKIEYYKRKQALIGNLSVLDKYQEVLTEKIGRLGELIANNEFTTEEFYLNIESGASIHNKVALYTVKNPAIISDVLGFVIERIKVKRDAVKAEIEA